MAYRLKPRSSVATPLKRRIHGGRKPDEALSRVFLAPDGQPGLDEDVVGVDVAIAVEIVVHLVVVEQQLGRRGRVERETIRLKIDEHSRRVHHPGRDQHRIAQSDRRAVRPGQKRVAEHPEQEEERAPAPGAVGEVDGDLAVLAILGVERGVRPLERRRVGPDPKGVELVLAPLVGVRVVPAAGQPERAGHCKAERDASSDPHGVLLKCRHRSIAFGKSIEQALQPGA